MDGTEKIAKIMAKGENMSVSEARRKLSGWHEEILKISLIVQYSERVMEQHNIPLKAKSQQEWVENNPNLALELELLSEDKVWWNLGAVGLSIRAYDLQILLNDELYKRILPESKWSLRKLFGYSAAEWGKVKKLLSG